MAFWILWGIDAVIALIFIFFFVLGLVDGSVSSFNIWLWLGVLLVLAAVLGGGFALRAAGNSGIAIALLAIVAVPGILAGLLLLAALVFKPKWN